MTEKQIVKQVVTALIIKFGNTPMNCSEYLELIDELQQQLGEHVRTNFQYTTNGYVRTTHADENSRTVHLTKQALDLLK